ncbi:ABC-2 type transport system permease protein [Zhouia amylolytica]|uniref:ABC-2 type transport system permease protein n=1 Tax=Zhouia amylolytica TaxID=376730 RepID=A0A1I6U4K7_9FLAO|nr:hypothetical protein [Zhouia amylolytica]SFS96383.1 ABC-2 type transport system permease protein [Zhouia amylolytica]
MTFVLIFFGILIGLNLIPGLIKKEYPKTEKIITRIVFYATIIFLILILLSFFGIRFKGLYTNTIIGLTFLISSLFYFATKKNTRNKIKSIVILFPLILAGLYLQFFNQNLGTYKVNDELNINISQEGFLACGEIIRLTKSRLLIFEKELIYDSNQCLRGIDRIEMIEFNDKRAEFLIYHNREMDSENPYPYEIENKNVW